MIHAHGEDFRVLTSRNGRRVKKKRLFPEEQIVNARRQAEVGRPAVEGLPAKLGSAEQTFYRWKRQFAGEGSRRVAAAASALAVRWLPKGRQGQVERS